MYVYISMESGLQPFYIYCHDQWQLNDWLISVNKTKGITSFTREYNDSFDRIVPNSILITKTLEKKQNLFKFGTLHLQSTY